MVGLAREFYARDTLTVARDLLGRILVRVLNGTRLSGRIVEVEAYIGQEDQACHARVGLTERNRAMFGPPGHAYIYLIYGVHHCLNVVTDQEGFPAAVLIRALEPLEGLVQMQTMRGGRSGRQLTSGPGKLCQALAIDRQFDQTDLCVPGASLFLEAGQRAEDQDVATSPRVGVRGDEAALTAPWRFFLRDNQHISSGK